MTIKEKGYSHWEGRLEERKFPWWPITRTGIQLTFRKKYFKFIYFFSFVPAFVYLVGLYISERLEDFKHLLRGSDRFLQVNPAYFKSYFTGDFLFFMIVMMLVFCGAELISEDFRSNALQLYFSRPLRKKDYFLGKSFILFFFLLSVTFIPGILLFLLKLVFSGSFKFFLNYPWLILSIIGYSFLITSFFSFYSLLLSSLSKNRRYVAILTWAIYIFSDIVAGVFYGNFRNPRFFLFSIKCNLQQVGAVFFNQKLPYDVSWIYSLLILLCISLLGAMVLNKKIRGVEVIK